MRKNDLINCNGFTLVELLIAMAISGIVAAAIFTAFKSQQDSYVMQGQVVEVQQNLRAAIDIMARELRMAGYDPRGTANFGLINVLSSTQNSISFSWDMNDNGTYEPSTELISYRFNSGSSTLERQVGSSGWQTVAEKITGATFTFLDSSGIPTAIANNIRRVNVALLASEGSHSRQLSCQVVCRNIGL